MQDTFMDPFYSVENSRDFNFNYSEYHANPLHSSIGPFEFLRDRELTSKQKFVDKKINKKSIEMECSQSLPEYHQRALNIMTKESDCQMDVMPLESPSSTQVFTELFNDPLVSRNNLFRHSHLFYKNLPMHSLAMETPIKKLESWAFKKFPKLFKEHEFNIEKFDKIFSSTWISEDNVVFGTKCDNFVILNTRTGKQTKLPKILPRQLELETAPYALQSHMNQFFMSMNQQTLSPFQDDSLSRHMSFNAHCTGIHSIQCNPSKTLIAVGSGKPHDSIQIYKLPTFEPFAILLGHVDMVFSIAWISDTVLMSASRDKFVRFWSLDSDDTSNSMELDQLKTFRPLESFEERGKVRDLQVDMTIHQAATLSADGYVKLWDTQTLKATDLVPLFHTNELVCMCHDEAHHLYGIGSQSHISLLDPRSSSIVHTVESLDEGWGVRSLLIQQGVMLIGGGMGRLSFYDLTAQKYMEWTKEETLMLSHQTGSGWLQKDTIYTQHFRDIEIKNAIYTMSLDATSTRLFLGGGPLQLSLKGSYAGIWRI